MGNEQSSNASKNENLSQTEVNRLLNLQKAIYEEKCQKYLSQAAQSAKAAAESAKNAQAAQNALEAARSAQNAAAPLAAQVTPPAYNAQPGTYMQRPAFTPQPAYLQQSAVFPQNSTQHAGFLGCTSERQFPSTSSLPTAPTAPPLYPQLSNVTTPLGTFSFDNTNTNTSLNHNGNVRRIRPTAPSRDRSSSRPRNDTNSGNSGLKCITCKALYGLQIFQCKNGHSSCKSCKDQSRCCGICGNIITEVRNYTIEGYIAEQKVECPHSNNGCKLLIKMLDMDIHTKECPFKELQCPIGCIWKGHLNQLSSHFDAMHPQQRTANVDSEIQLRDISNNSQNTYLILIGNFNFLLHVKVSAPESKIYMSVQLIGTKLSASNWTYELHIYNKGQPRRKFTFIDSCSSYVEPVADIFREGQCCVLPQAYASTFVNNGVLIYKIFVKRIVESRPRGGSDKNRRGRGK